MSPAQPLILASASPRRHTILAEMGYSFEIDPADVDETPAEGLAPREVAIALAMKKALTVAARCPGRTVVGADTIVALGDRLLGKPVDAADAQRTLTALSGSTHEVITGVAVVDGVSGREVADADVTRVTMRAMTAAEIDAYVETGECFGKAGAYAIQEKADRFVTSLDGPYDNVVGFPSLLFRRLMDELAGSSPGDLTEQPGGEQPGAGSAS